MAKLVWHNFPNLKLSLGKLVFAGWLSLSLLDETAEAKNSRAGNVNLSDQLIGMSLVWCILESMHSQIPNLGQNIPDVTEKIPPNTL